MGERITFNRPDGASVAGYLAPAVGGAAAAPGVVMIQEWWGLSDQITGLADRLAQEGFNVLAPDLYAGRVVPYHDAEAANREMTSLDFIDAVDQTLRGAAHHLLKDAKKVGVTGFCMGGAMTVIAAARAPQFTCGVAFYGLPPAAAATPADVKIPLQGHFASKDDWCTPAAVDAFAKGLTDAGKTFEFFRYDADHAFINQQRGTVYDRQAAELAWARAVAFLKAQLA